MTAIDDRFPQSVRDIWAALKDEVIWLHGRWLMYRQLYGTSPERIELLNQSASTFFVILNDVLLRDIQLSLSKLGDPAQSQCKKNMTLATLEMRLTDCGQHAAVSKLKPLIEEYNNTCQKLRHRRHKTIAHSDLETALAGRVEPIRGPSRAEIESALAALRAVMNFVEFHYTNTQTRYELFIMTDDGDALIHSLKKGLRYGELVKEQVIDRGDLHKRFRKKA